MSAKPLRNSKGLNKPFRSPFTNGNTPRCTNVNGDSHTPETNLNKTPLRNSVSKKLLFQQTPPSKRQCLSNVSLGEPRNTDQERNICHSDLDALKIRVKEKQKCIDDFKIKLLYKRKNKPEDLEAAIEKWTIVCQDILRDYHSQLEEKRGHSINMSEILDSFGIDHCLVRFSSDDDTFY